MDDAPATFSAAKPSNAPQLASHSYRLAALDPDFLLSGPPAWDAARDIHEE